jgi:hypothetical protein
MYVQEQLKQPSDMKVSVKEKQIKSSQLPLKKNCFFIVSNYIYWQDSINFQDDTKWHVAIS